MAEQVNQRIENVVNELEQMQRTNLYTPEEIREISRKIKELEYRLQRRTKQKNDFTEYISYHMVLLEDIALRRKQIHLSEKRNEIEYSIAKRLNKVFKQFIYRFQDDVEIYFQYIMFCTGVKFDHAISGIISQMIQIHGDKEKMWLLASKWELETNDNSESAKKFLLQGLQRHPDAELLYLELLFLELTDAFKANDDALKEKMLTRADIVWKNAIKKIQNVRFHSKVCSLINKFACAFQLKTECCEEFWSRYSDDKLAWEYIAKEEINENQWQSMDEYVKNELSKYPDKIKRFVSIYETAIDKFSDESIATSYIHQLLKLGEYDCSKLDKITLVLDGLRFCHEKSTLSVDLYDLWIDMLVAGNDYSLNDLLKILEDACAKKPTEKWFYEKQIILNKGNDKAMMMVVQQAKLKTEDLTHLWDTLLDNVSEKATMQKLYEKCKQCNKIELIKLKPKFLKLCYELNGLKPAIKLCDELVTTPPIQIEVYDIMIEILKNQEKIDGKMIRKYFDSAVRHFGTDSPKLWLRFVDFEYEHGSPKLIPALYQRALNSLNKEVVDDFIKEYMLKKSGISYS